MLFARPNPTTDRRVRFHRYTRSCTVAHHLPSPLRSAGSRKNDSQRGQVPFFCSVRHHKKNPNSYEMKHCSAAYVFSFRCGFGRSFLFYSYCCSFLFGCCVCFRHFFVQCVDVLDICAHKNGGKKYTRFPSDSANYIKQTATSCLPYTLTPMCRGFFSI